MKRGKCIYCKQEKKLNREHAFPECLLDERLRGTEHEWIIDRHLCSKCNSDLGELDVILGKKSLLAFTADRIQDELGNKIQSLHSSIYRKRARGINPVRLFLPDPLYDNHILLHETAMMSSETRIPVDSATAMRPQILLMQYAVGRVGEEVIEENFEIFNASASDEDFITDYDEHKDIYCILGNTYVFPPRASEYFFQRVPEFKSNFMTDFPNTRYDLRVLFPEESQYQGAAETFCNSFVSETKQIIEDEKIPDPIPLSQLIEVRIDRKAIPVIARAIAKVVFHSFLYHYPEFNGHEPLFAAIREFIFAGSSNRFVAECKNTETQNCVYDFPEHLHIFCFHVQEDGIGCRMDLFTGLQTPPVSFQVILASNPNAFKPKPNRWEAIPFFVHPNSQMKNRIFPIDRFSTLLVPKSRIWTPN